jgi:hypothetical protein
VIPPRIFGSIVTAGLFVCSVTPLRGFETNEPNILEVKLNWEIQTGGDFESGAWNINKIDDSVWSGFDEYTGCKSGRGVYARKIRLRALFTLPSQVEIARMLVELRHAAPFRLFLNGIEVFSSPWPLPTYVDVVTGETRGFEINLDGMSDELVLGDNFLAIEFDYESEQELCFGGLPILRLELDSLDTQGLDPAGPISSRSSDNTVFGRSSVDQGNARFVILMICDGWGAQHIEVANQYLGTPPSYQSSPEWTKLWMATFPAGGSYDQALAWSDFTYPLQGATDSAAAATAMYT